MDIYRIAGGYQYDVTEVLLFKGTHEALRANPHMQITIIVLLVGQAMMVLYLGGTHDGILCSQTFLHTFTLSSQATAI
jgi:hypothetical protein